MSFKLLRELLVFHGGASPVDTKVEIPFFTTLSIDGAGYYAMERRNEPDPGFITAFDVDTSKMFDAVEDFDGYFQMAVDAGINMDQKSAAELYDEPFWSDEIQEEGHDGSNTSDLVYLPKFREQFLKKGFNVIKISDVLTNDEIIAYIVLDPSAIKFKSAVPVSDYDEVNDLNDGDFS